MKYMNRYRNLYSILRSYQSISPAPRFFFVNIS